MLWRLWLVQTKAHFFFFGWLVSSLYVIPVRLMMIDLLSFCDLAVDGLVNDGVLSWDMW